MRAWYWVGNRIALNPFRLRSERIRLSRMLREEALAATQADETFDSGLARCPYYRHVGDQKCTYGCWQEPRCQTDAPVIGWSQPWRLDNRRHLLHMKRRTVRYRTQYR